MRSGTAVLSWSAERVAVAAVLRTPLAEPYPRSFDLFERVHLDLSVAEVPRTEVVLPVLRRVGPAETVDLDHCAVGPLPHLSDEDVRLAVSQPEHVAWLQLVVPLLDHLSRLPWSGVVRRSCPADERDRLE